MINGVFRCLAYFYVILTNCILQPEIESHIFSKSEINSAPLHQIRCWSDFMRNYIECFHKYTLQLFPCHACF